MFSIQDIIDSYLKPKRFKQNYNERIRASLKNGAIDWDKRARLASKSLLTAVCYREVSLSTLEKTNSLIFPPIGFYYSVFHLSVALLKLEYTTNLDELRRVRHEKLINLVESKLIQTKIVKGNFITIFRELKELRESCNYGFGYSEELNEKVKLADELTENAFDEGVSFIHQVLKEANSLLSFQVGIGDGFGDDILETYLSQADRERVVDYLVLNGLTS